MLYNGKMRYLQTSLEKDLKKKMVLLAGPRQSGKTTLAKSLCSRKGYYLNWDIQKDRKIIRDVAWPKDKDLVVLDEFHKAPKWKNILKGLADEYHNKPALLITGSARLETFRNSGDALTGRHYLYRLHPMDLWESSIMDKKTSQKERIQKLLSAGGFPEAYFHPKDADRLRKDRMEIVVKEDLIELSRIHAWRGPSDLLEILRDHVGQSIGYDSFTKDLGASAPTIKNWIMLLEKLYLIFLVPPYFKNVSNSIRKEKKAYFYDSAAAYDSTMGAQIENLVASSLLKFCHFKQDTLGENWELFYLRDKQKHEVDFVLTKNKKVDTLIEVKKSEDRISTGFRYFHDRLKPRRSVQLVLELDREMEKDGIKILPLGDWIESLYTVQKNISRHY